MVVKSADVVVKIPVELEPRNSLFSVIKHGNSILVFFT
mgnify:CR=1 FL=1